jgi:hypothetical protein
MQALFMDRHRTLDQSPAEILRAHIEQLSLEVQSEVVDLALRVIATRPTFREAKVVAYDDATVTMRKRFITH